MTVSVNANVFFLLHTLLGNLLAILFNEPKIFDRNRTFKDTDIQLFLPCKQLNFDT